MIRMGLGILLMLSALSPANGEEARPALGEIRAQQAQIYQDARANRGAYADMSERERELLLSKQESVLSLIDGKESVEELERDERMLVFNGLESIRAIIEGTEADRLVCGLEKKTGTHLKTAECRSVAQKRGDREDAVGSWSGQRAVCGRACVN